MGVDGARDGIHFARIFGQILEFGMLAPDDYLWIEESSVDTTLAGTTYTSYSYDFHAYQNTGVGGTKLKGKLRSLELGSNPS
jgi:hypothetical protein